MAGRKPATRRQKNLLEELVLLSSFCLIVFCAVGVTWLIVEPLEHPNLHPRIIHLYYQLQHYHPTLQRSLCVIPILLILTQGMLLKLIEHRFDRKKVIDTRAKTRTDRPLKLSWTQSISLDAHNVWLNLSVALPGMPIGLPGETRPTHWRLVETHESTLRLSAHLTYCHDVTGSRSPQMYPRTINCLATVEGKGLKSDVTLVYSSASPMDYHTVKCLIEQTNANLFQALENQPEIDSMRVLDTQIRAYKDVESATDLPAPASQTTTPTPLEYEYYHSA